MGRCCMLVFLSCFPFFISFLWFLFLSGFFHFHFSFLFLISSFTSRCALIAKHRQRVVLFQTLFRGWVALGRRDSPLQRGLHCVSVDLDALPLVSPNDVPYVGCLIVSLSVFAFTFCLSPGGPIRA
ncbi:hypothetical protein P170DRAFT_203646 [Aspergillus steynii IBT 23096]|uniref:Uncharacterized protein n=1 Tax=Aspergillus steynii IBT 23096 TaxID=1392250 RepID=A0A2I2G579_9EURO|nr:uncharacterized protein P170DRAFT_203646 [Aspergillus steynii IBT 23096]PLB48035.1 hypothetical protein P170DRAFT_203646 [Aspergillus steynii IBT 23096]